MNPPASTNSRSLCVAGNRWKADNMANWTFLTAKKGDVSTKSPPGRVRSMLPNASSISRLVPALSTWTSSVIVRAAASTARILDSLRLVSAGLTSTTIRLAPGTTSRKSCSRFASSSAREKANTCCVSARPGQARHKTGLDRVISHDECNGNCRSSRFSR